MGTGSCHDLCLMIADVDKDGKSCVPASWSKYAEFDRTVLKKVKTEINKFSDIRIDYTPIREDFSGKKYKKYVSIEFAMCGKTEEEIKKRDGFIVEEYRSFFEEEENGQLVLTDLLGDSKQKSDDKSEKVSSFRKKFPAFCEEFEEYGFTENQLKRLQQLACENKSLRIPFAKLDLWVTDYVAYYYNEIIASEKETKTSVYARLKDCVEKDYKGRGIAPSPWEEIAEPPVETYTASINTIPEMVEVVEGNVVEVLHENVNNGADPTLAGVVFLSGLDKNREYKENTYKKQGFMVRVVSQEEYIQIKRKIMSN